jgi:hypothetical protein
MRQDKFLKLLKAQFRWNRLPEGGSSHSLHPEIWTLTELTPPIKNPGLARLPDKFGTDRKLATSFGSDFGEGDAIR